MTVNAAELNAPHREGAGSVGAAEVVRSALKRISRRGIRAPTEAACQPTAEHLPQRALNQSFEPFFSAELPWGRFGARLISEATSRTRFAFLDDIGSIGCCQRHILATKSRSDSERPRFGRTAYRFAGIRCCHGARVVEASSSSCSSIAAPHPPASDRDCGSPHRLNFQRLLVDEPIAEAPPLFVGLGDVAGTV